MNNKYTSEVKEQIALFDWAKLKNLVMVHIPNEGKRNSSHGAILNKMGLRKGFPDIFVPRANLGLYGAFIELKQDRIYKNSEMRTLTWQNQQWWLDYLNDQGYYAVRAYGWYDAAMKLGSFYFEDTIVK